MKANEGYSKMAPSLSGIEAREIAKMFVGGQDSKFSGSTLVDIGLAPRARHENGPEAEMEACPTSFDSALSHPTGNGARLPRRKFLKATLAAALLPRAAWAQAYPTRPVHIVVGYAAGGPTDIAARLIGQALSQRLGVV